MCRPYTSLSRPIYLWFKQTYRQPTFITDMIIKKNIKLISNNAETQNAERFKLFNEKK